MSRSTDFDDYAGACLFETIRRKRESVFNRRFFKKLAENRFLPKKRQNVSTE